MISYDIMKQGRKAITWTNADPVIVNWTFNKANLRDLKAATGL